MNSAQWRQIEELYDAARNCESGKRAALMARADPEVRAAVERMLVQPSAGSPLDSPAWEGTSGPDVPQPAIGSQLGPYRIEAALGAGGMGTIFRAVDTRLNRTVAIKIPGEPFTGRFEREARAIAALNHPNICTVHDVGPNYLVMELVDGPTLAERIRKGRVPLDEAIAIARQIADALEAAHERGIVHRDLKPANIKIKPDGTIKVLDFGLARLARPAEPADEDQATQSVTMTEPGTLLGTPSYMAPEQAMGKPVDKRADIWAFGVVVYEMLAGARPFAGGNTAEILSAVLAREPDWNRIPAAARPLLKRCLEKDPKRRLRDIGDAPWTVEELPADQSQVGRRWWIAAAAGSVVGAAGAWSFAHFRQAASEERVLRLEIDPPEGGHFTLSTNLTGISISPDGKNAAYVATTGGKTAIWLRPLDGAAARKLEGTEDGALPFWSPDSKSIAYFGGGKLQRIDLPGSAPQTLCDLPLACGGSWGSNGQILLGLWNSGIYQVSAAGGNPVPLTALDASRGEAFHYWPQSLPGGRFLYFVRSHMPGNSGVFAASLAEPHKPTRLLATEMNALFAPAIDGKEYLLWLRDGTLVAQNFDPSTLTLSGEIHSIAHPVAFAGVHSQMRVAVSATGVLLYSASDPLYQLSWFDGEGKRLGKFGEPIEKSPFNMAPDGRHIVLHRSTPGGVDMWMLNVERGVSTRFTSRRGLNIESIWSPDSRTVIFASGPPFNMFRKAASGAGGEERIMESPNTQFPMDCSRDGRFLLYEENITGTQKNALWLLPLTSANPQPRLYLPAPYNQRVGHFSPDGRWVSFQADDSGRWEIYVDAFPEPRGRIQISTGGGELAQWAPNGRELFYIAPDSKLMSVTLKLLDGSVAPLPPKALFPVQLLDAGLSPYQVAPDVRLLVLEPPEHDAQPLTVIVNWPALLRGTP